MYIYPGSLIVNRRIKISTLLLPTEGDMSSNFKYSSDILSKKDANLLVVIFS